MSKFVKDIAPLCSSYELDLSSLAEELELNAGEVLWRKVDLFLVDFP